MSDVSNDPNAWWSELTHGGMLISPALLKEFLPEGPKVIDSHSAEYQRLRDAYAVFLSWSQSAASESSNDGLYRWLDAIFDRFLDYPAMMWQKEQAVSDRFKWQTVTGERLRPNRVFLDKGFEDYCRFLLKVDTRKGRLGMGKGRVEYSKFLTLLRGTKVPFGIFTNGHQLRLVYAGLDYDCYVEWDLSRWFEEESGLAQLAGFVSLCGQSAMYKTDTDPYPLATVVLNSRTRQGELSEVLGEQVRSAVELLLSSFDKAARTHPDLLELLRIEPTTNRRLSESEVLHALYIASIRVMMRMVVVLFAEARELLPRNMEDYNASYGIEGLFASLEEAARHGGEEELREMTSAWPRLLALFNVTYQGSPAPDIPINRYGGELFKAGNRKSPDPVLRALAVFEDERWGLDDLDILRIVRKLKIGMVRTRRGRSSTWVSGPVDFSDLRTEYIGMMYEGLLDYELRQVTEEQKAVVFLNLGQIPALPLSLLESLSDVELKNLINKLGKEKAKALASEEEAEEESEETEDEPEELDESETVESAPDVVINQDEAVRKQVDAWAERTVDITQRVRPPRSGTDSSLYKQERAKAAQLLIDKVFGPGEMYLVRSSGSRKGTGTFYTRPQLAVPTVHRTLEPLVYDKKEGSEELIPKSPEIILSLKVVDPAMGSGSFLVAALRYLTDALYESLIYHKKIREHSASSCIVTLPFGDPSTGNITEELLPAHPGDEQFELRLKPRLKRYVVERCIYGVDLNPLAVELARLSLWVETMDRELPFEFLAHKLKIGNSLVGTWFDRFQEYPVMAWMREGGDKDHNGVHYEKGRWTKAIKEMLEKRVKPELVRYLKQTVPLEYEFGSETKVSSLHEKAVKLFEELHKFPLFGEGIQQREEFYRTRIRDDPELTKLKDAFDLWCAVWFWPGDWLDENAPTPDKFYNPNRTIIERTRNLVDHHRFFHWELEFPDVFITGKGGFDAVVGNPPWETSKPNSKEFFTMFDPIYRTYGKQDAISHQNELFTQHEEIERRWLTYSCYFKSMSNWNKYVASPFGDPLNENDSGSSITLAGRRENEHLHRTWQEKRKRHFGYVDPKHPFLYQGSADINTYKMFLEFAYCISKKSGRLGFIVPSGIYADKGSFDLRVLFLEDNVWEWLFCFENRKKIFNIHRSAKFCPIIIEKGGTTTSIKTAFMQHDLSNWENPSQFINDYLKVNIYTLSPKYKTFCEIRNKDELYLLNKLYYQKIFFFDEGEHSWGIDYHREYDIPGDMAKNKCPDIPQWKENNFSNNGYDKWINPQGDIAIPVIEGRMIDQFVFSAKGWISGRGRSSIWEEIPRENMRISPQYLIKIQDYFNWNKAIHDNKIVYMGITSTTNTRTVISSYIGNWLCDGNIPVLTLKNNTTSNLLLLTAFLNSYIFDWIVRIRLGGNKLTRFVLEDLILPKMNEIDNNIRVNLVLYATSLTLIHQLFSSEWIQLSKQIPKIKKCRWKNLWAVTPYEQLRIRCIIDAIIAELYSLDTNDFSWILRDCAHSQNKIRDISSKLDPKGFWRVDKDKPPELRQAILSIAAFRNLKKIIKENGGNPVKGINAFCEQNNGDGWEIPETITFIQRENGIIEFDTSDSQTYEVRSKLGERFLQWQLEGTPEESWKECEEHVKKILEYNKYVDTKNDFKSENNISFKSNKKNNTKSILEWGDKI